VVIVVCVVEVVEVVVDALELPVEPLELVVLDVVVELVVVYKPEVLPLNVRV
jgi:hypothetical protein